MLTRDLKNLEIFQGTQSVDSNVAKSKAKNRKFSDINDAFEAEIESINNSYSHSLERMIQRTPENISIWDRVSAFRNQNSKFKNFKFITELWKQIFVYRSGLEPEKFFDAVKTTFEVLDGNVIEKKTILKQLDVFEKSLQKAAKNVILIEEIIAENEKKLKDAGFDRYQSEEAMVEFIKNSKSGICLSDIQSFKYEIPDKVLDRLLDVECLEVFDNYYILYTDPNWKEEIKKQEEEKIKKDPILFGTMVGSNRLYYVADWISDYCKLTYSELLKINKDTKLI